MVKSEINSVKKRRRSFCLITGVARVALLIFLIPGKLTAQVLPPAEFSISRTAITASNEELVDVLVKIRNVSAQTIKAKLSVNAADNLELVSKAETPIVLPAGDSSFLPVKVFVNKKAVSGKTHLVDFKLINYNGEVLASASAMVSIKEKRKVNLFSMLANVLIDNATDSLVIPVRVTNTGNTAQKITLVGYFPSFLQDNSFQETREIILAPSADTLINFTRTVTKKMVETDGFDVNITGLYANSDVIGVAYVRVQSARSTRNYRDRPLTGDFDENSMVLGSQNMFSPTELYMLKGRGNIGFTTGRLGYNMDLTAWKSGYAPPTLRSTWMEYKTPLAGIKAGNISKSLDVNLSGRGASVFFNDTASSNRYETGYIDGNSNLLGNNAARFFPSDKSGWGAFSHTVKKWQVNSFALYSISPGTNSKNMILGNSFLLTSKKRLRYTATFNVGRASEFLNNKTSKFGMSAGATVSGTINNISINSANYYSSGYYPGLQRGALTLTERIVHTGTASNTWVNFDYHRYKPLALSRTQFFLPEFGNMRIEAGISGKIDKLNFSVSPGFVRETNNAYQFDAAPPAMQFMKSWNVASTFNYTIGDNQFLSVNTDAGIYTPSFDPATHFHLRTNAHYKKGLFILNATFQMGAFFMGEAANNFTRNINSVSVLNVVPSFQKSFMRNRLRTEESIAYAHNSYSGSSLYLTGRVEYDVTPGTSFYSVVNRNRYNGYGNSIIEMGIIKKLKVPKKHVKSNSLELFAFEDINRNGVFDETDSVASGYILYINDDLFMTSPSGTVSYKNLPNGKYRLSMPVSNGWYAPEQYIDLDKKLRIEIPLNRTGTLKGTITYQANDLSYEVNKNVTGITLIATDKNNNHYKTRTNPDGQYVFYIPVGDYSIAVSPNQLPSEVEVSNNNQQVLVAPQKVRLANFDLVVKTRKIDARKFVSPSVSGK